MTWIWKNNFFNCSGEINSESHIQISIFNPFVDSDGGDYLLDQATENGMTLTFPFDIDHAGVIRGWTIFGIEVPLNTIQHMVIYHQNQELLNVKHFFQSH